ncbi:hypothetical protein RhiirB3_394834 [Rhizophagus irregularis]|nr:hypothetical protein RhiirB3_394834 [Rhizophagus irregularis]
MGYEGGKIFEEGFLEKFSEVEDELEGTIRRELKSDIKRLFRLGFNCYELIADGFIRKYLEDREEDDKEIQRNLLQHLETKEHGKMSDEESDESNESDNVEGTETTKIFEEIIRMDLKRTGYDVEISEIERIRKFGVTAKIITTYEFIKKYLTIWNLKDEELDKQILQWRAENTKECKRCEVERLEKEFKIRKEICIECEKDIEKENPPDDKDEVEEDIKGPEIGSSKKPKKELLWKYIPAFYRTSGEDPEEWANKFEEAFTANGLGNDDTQRFLIAKTRLMGGAADWLKTEGVNIVDWNVNGDHNLRLRVRIIGKYASDEIKDRWLEQLEKIIQGNENVTQYLTRFKYMLKRAGGDAAVAANQQKRIFMKGLKSDFIKDVTMGNPADLNAVFQIAKNVERGLTSGIHGKNVHHMYIFANHLHRNFHYFKCTCNI